jgi:hypothetical protein
MPYRIAAYASVLSLFCLCASQWQTTKSLTVPPHHNLPTAEGYFQAATSTQKPVRKSLVGTWKLNLAKSVWGKVPAPREDTLVVTRDDEKGLRWAASGVSADGDRFSYSFEGAADGKDYPMKSPNNDAVIGFTRAYSRIRRNLHAVDKKDGAVIQTSTTRLSNDGQTMTIKFVSSASEVTWTEVLDRIK